MAQANVAKPPDSLNLEDKSHRGENWRQFKRDWHFYEVAAEIDKKDGKVRVAHLLNVIGREAQDMFETFELTDAELKDIDLVLAKFEERCMPATNIIYERYLFNKRAQEPGESIDAYLTHVMKLADTCNFGLLKDEMIRDRLVSGVRGDSIREKLLGKKDLTLDKAIEMLRSHHATQLFSKDMASEESRVHSVDKRNKYKRMAHSQANKAKTTQFARHTSAKDTTQNLTLCKFCGSKHIFKRSECKAADKECRNCGKVGHFAKVCRSKKKVNSVESESYGEELFWLNSLQSQDKTDQVISFEVGQNHPVTFQMDTGSSCNILPLADYIKATGDKAVKEIRRTNTRLIMHNGASERAIGKVQLRVERNGNAHLLNFVVVKRRATPLLGMKSCIGMGLIKILDSDNGSVLAVSEAETPLQANPKLASCSATNTQGSTSPANVMNDSVLRDFADVFEGLGTLPTEYTIELKEDVKPVVNPPRKVPVAQRDVIKQELDRMVEDAVIAPVSEPTPWVSNMVIVSKKNGKIRICLDPRDLNAAIKRSHYPLPTIEEVATRLHNAKVFSVLDAKTGFWQVKLDERSSYLTTFATPFGRYRWLRMPFGINSAPEVWQHRMNVVIEGLLGVEVIADDFLVCGFGESYEAAVKDHDENLRRLLQRAQERGLKLNKEKIKLRLTKVPFIGHLLTPEGLAPDPAKVQAVLNMPTPTDLQALQRFLGMTQYLSKFLPRLSEVTDPLRKLEHKGVDWNWLPDHDEAITAIKQLISQAPVLRYYDVREEVTIQADASQTGLGFALLQNGQPVAYGARALTPTEQNYAQIEKEMLAIVVACEKFEQYIYGRHVTIESDHKPLVSIHRKPMHSVPKRLQRMLLRLQKFDVDITYKKGELMYIADTLSRACTKDTMPQTEPESEFCHQLESVDLTDHLPISQERLHQFCEETAKDVSLQAALKLTLTGWPQTKKEVEGPAQPFFTCREELTAQNGLLFKGNKIVVPTVLRPQMLSKVHNSHLGIEGSLRRAREVLYWPLMNAEVRDYISKCSICNAMKPEQCKEPMMSAPVPERPWSRVACDLLEHEGKPYMVVTDYYSNFFEVERLNDTQSSTVINKLKPMFARHGIPNIVVSDNGPQFASQQFRRFATSWEFQHITSSPRHPQSNGKAENSVKTAKMLMKKATRAKGDFHLYLLDFRNTPDEHLQLSPAQRIFGRRTRTLMPTTANLLRPPMANQVKQGLQRKKEKQVKYYNRSTKSLSEIHKGQVVRMKRPGDTHWSQARCHKQVTPRSYIVESAGRLYRRNRRYLRTTPEEYYPDSPANVQFEDDPPEPSAAPQQQSLPQSPVKPAALPEASAPQPVPPGDAPEVSSQPATPRTYRPKREVRKPARFRDFVC